MALPCHGGRGGANPRCGGGALTPHGPCATPGSMTLDILRSDTIAATHGFFGRRGGASSGVFAGLNCGTGSTDQREAVATNRARVAEAMGVAGLRSMRQVHSARVATMDADTPQGERLEADAMVTAVPGIALTILTADCLPVLFDGGHAIGAAHAGWKGTLGGVLENTVGALHDLGARDIRAAIGPAISQPAYEVGPELRDAFLASDPDAAAFFAPGRGDRLHLDLPGYARHRLARVGVEARWTGHCTYGDPDRFYSYRRATHRNEADYGRLIAAIRL